MTIEHEREQRSELMFHWPIPPLPPTPRYSGYAFLIDLGPISFLCMRLRSVGYLLLLIDGRGRRWRWSTSLYGLRTRMSDLRLLPGMRTLDLPLMRRRIWYGVISSTTRPPFQASATWRGSSVSRCRMGRRFGFTAARLAYERMRGIYLDGAVLDEYPLLHPNAFTSVVRPCLADYRGFAIVSGTAAGEDHFHALKLRAEDDDHWDIFDIPVTARGRARSIRRRLRRCVRT